MIYNEQQLESFSRRAFKYEEQKIIDTHHAIRAAIDQYYDRNAVKEQYDLGELPVLDVYLQGSYKNSTNVTKTSDVDLVVQMKTIWRDNKESLSEDQLAKYEATYRNVSYAFGDFRHAILHAVQAYFGMENVTNANKCIKIKEHGRYCNADVIASFTYRHYGMFERIDKQDFKEGMCFITNDGEFIRDFPKLHYDALIKKSEATNGTFKETVRMFKNIRDDLIDRRVLYPDVAKSYFVENLLYFLPDSCFIGTRLKVFEQVILLLMKFSELNMIRNFKCANGVDPLFGENNWQYAYAQLFFDALKRVQQT